MQGAGADGMSGLERARQLVDAGAAASRSNDSARALSLWREASAALPSWGLPHLLIGSEYASQGEWEKAEAELANAVLLAPELLLARYQLGLLQFSSGRAAVALVTWQLLLANEQDPSLSDFVQGFTALAQDLFEEARGHFGRGLGRPGANPAVAADVRKVLEKMPPRVATAQSSPNGEGNAQAHLLLANYEHFKLH